MTTIVNVKQQPSGLYLVTDSDGKKHATKNAWLATLAQRYRQLQTPVVLHGGAGWYYRDLAAITPETAEPTAGA